MPAVRDVPALAIAAAVVVTLGALLVATTPGATPTDAAGGASHPVVGAAHPSTEALPWTGLTIPVGSGPWGEALDPSNGLLFVTDSQGANVTVLNTSTNSVVATVPVGTVPLGIVYDPENGLVYVANSGSYNVSVLNGTSLRVAGSFDVGSSDMGSGPYGVAVDPDNGQLYVSYYSYSGDCVRMFDAATGAPVGSVATASGAICTGFGYDPRNGQMYVSAINFSRTYVINATTDALTTTIVGAGPDSFAFDPSDDEMVGIEPNAVVFFNGSSESIAATTTITAPADGILADSVVYDAATGSLFASGFGSPIFELNGTTGTLIGTSPWDSGNDLALGPGNAVLYSSEPSPDQVVASPATVYPVAVNVTGDVAGVLGPWELNVSSPTGPDWTWFAPLDPNGTFLVPNGTYDYAAAVPEWLNSTPVLPNGSFVVDGAGITLSFAFAEVAVDPVTFEESGLPVGASWSVTSGVPAITNASSGSSIPLRVRSGSLPIGLGGPAGYSVASIAGPGDPSSREVNVSGASTFVVRFAPALAITFDELGLPAGSVWGVTIRSAHSAGGPAAQTASTSGTSIEFSVPKGTWKFAVTVKPSNERAVVGHGSMAVGAHSVLRTLRFVPVDARVAFVAKGLPRGTAWTVNVTGPNGTTSLRGTAATLSELLPNGSYSFEVGAVGTRTPAPANGTVVVVAPHAEMKERITFSAAVPPALPAGPTGPAGPLAMPGRAEP
ncbi:MAG TPA: YncE family protein [Thermoplasmata archaeon]|nr:YncE family protein [Thermoplasmata archaeon]